MKPRTWFALSVAVALAPAPGPAGASGIFQVTSSAARDRHPTWDLDDQSVVFESNRSGHYHLYRLRVGETQAQQLTSGDSNEMMPEISPDGTRIVFASGLADMGGALLSSSLQVMPAQGGPATTLVPNTGPFIWHPTWSPDGQSIYYLFWGSSTGNYFEDIYRVSSSGGVPEKVVDIEEDAYPRISPDGRQIAFALREHGGPYNIAQAPLTDPSNYVLLTQETVNTSQPDYSPDGTLLVYVSRKINDALELYEMNLATSTSQRLTSDSDVWSHETYTQFPEYSHDGNWIAFSSARVTGDENIWLFSRTGESPFGNVLSAGSGQGLPGGGAVRVPISLECAQAAPALEFQVHDVPDLLTVTGVQVRDRAMNMTASFATDS